jgi:hypothetical protein
MKKIKSFYYGIFKVKKAAFALALFLASAMVLDAANLTLIITKNAGASQAAPIEVKNELGRICGAVNMPIKIVNKMLEKSGFGNKIFFGVSQDFITAKILYASVSAAAQKERAGFTRDFAVFGNANKKQFLAPTLYFSQGVFFNIKNGFWRFSGNEFKLLLLFLIIMAAFPRGTPLIKKSKIKI